MVTDALAAWKARSRKDVTLPSGTKVTIRLPDIQDLMASGEIPLPIFAKMKRLEDNPDELTVEDVAATQSFHRQVIQRTVMAVAGQDVRLSAEDIAELPADDRSAILAYAMRERNGDAPNGDAPKRGADAG